ncbi:hypothetical protein AUEXF2481DRAFT_39259 [Aureobasidium subglaciale EXF-2481]|uniref:Uncharacterized protein n=1 Tax=Aureobasidium subglaciale (strain EXF-2481) TaxID=1043005 RepID=A0A074YEM3_AURSE|nr:uncharacterized protein AUEXF2481DRAFT_39259 [Aureobasidium subglaciale EXF-2481]KEQ96175.1 hypothetical protein AUEXF2481DRAFT_39259 [Aureobasidium subglaciale EXF-2481]
MEPIMFPATQKLSAMRAQNKKSTTTTTSHKAKKVCSLTKWLLTKQIKLRTAISPCSTNIKNNSCSSTSSSSSSKTTQQRRIHNEVFGWTSDAWDELSMISFSLSSSTTTLWQPTSSSSHPPSKSSHPKSTGCMTREEVLRHAENYMLSRLETVFTNTNDSHPRRRETYLRVAGDA